MRNRLVLAALLGAAAGAHATINYAMLNQAALGVPAPSREVRGAWVATVYNIDWPTTRGATAANQTSQRNEMNAILNAMQTAKMNTVFLQVRSSADAMYPSTLEPWSYFLTGRQGRAPSGTYDPLQEWIDAARSRGMRLMAWVNPYRANTHEPQFQPPPGTGWNDAATTSVTNYVAPSHVYRENGSWLRLFTTTGGVDQYTLDPGEPAVRTYVRSVVMDIVNRYDVDGIVFDDYFYPYPISGQPFPDSATFALYGGGLTLANWRRQNVNQFIQAMYQDIKAAKPECLFGISPFGIWDSGVPAGISGLSSYDDIYADSKLWFNNGWLDFFSPQLYWLTTVAAQDYDVLQSWWASQNTQNRHLWISNGAYRMNSTDGNWPASELITQINSSRNTPGVTGNVFYSAKHIRDDLKSFRTTLASGAYAQPALPPASPWLDTSAPLRPVVTYTKSSTNHTFAWAQAPSSDTVRWWVVNQYIGTGWQTTIYPATTTSLAIPLKNPTGPLRAFAVAGVDRSGNMSSNWSYVLDATVLGATGR